jgi:hypothetical protein
MKWSSRGLNTSLLGYSLLTAFLFVPAFEAVAQTAGTFTPTGNMNAARYRHTATLLANGTVLITGGTSPAGEALSSAELYDPATGTFTPTGDMPIAQFGPSATLLADGRVLIAGNGAELYDPIAGVFTPAGSVVGSGLIDSATLLDSGKVLMLVGSHNELYDPLAGTFALTGDFAPLPQNDYDGLYSVPNIPLPNGKVLVAGEPATELYDPITATFSVGNTMATHPVGDVPLYIGGRTGTLLATGKVLLAGGANEDYGNFASAELYDPSTGVFTLTGSMSRWRAGHTATLIRDGTVLIGGSQVGLGGTASAELYDPATGAFTATADMTSARFWHTATLLMDGRILIVGGNLNPATAELYVPSVLVPAPVIENFRFDRSDIVAGSTYSVDVSGSSLTPQTFFDVRFTAPGSNDFAVVLNWQRGLSASHAVPPGIASGSWKITGVRAHETETDHTGNFIPVSATITVSSFN